MRAATVNLRFRLKAAVEALAEDSVPDPRRARMPTPLSFSRELKTRGLG